MRNPSQPLEGNPSHPSAGLEFSDKGTAGSAPSSRQQKALDAARNILALTEENLDREGLRDTPKRFAKAYQTLLGGYALSPSAAVGQGIFPSEGPGLIAVQDVEFYSMCEHHLLPFWGQATVAYFPGTKILGLSKIPRLVDAFARRVQVQERITQQLLEAIRDLLEPRAILVRLEAQHLCMMMRGVEKQRSQTATQAVYGFDQLAVHEREQLIRLMK